MEKIIAVVVTYNRKNLLLKVINALKKINYPHFNILIIDNASTDGTYDYISNEITTNIIYKNTAKNLGGAGGFSYGISEAIKLGFDYVWVMDDDCIPSNNTLDAFLSFKEKINNDFGYLSSKVLWTDGNPCLMNIQRVSLAQEIKDFTKNQRITLGSFVSLFLNSKAIIDLGLPYKDFFIWGDDWEYTYRISKKYKCYYVADSVVTHECKSNMGVSIVDDHNRVDRYFYAYRNEAFFYRKAHLKGIIYNFFKVNSHRLKLILKNPKDKKEKLNIISEGLKASKSFNPIIEYAYPNSKTVNVLEFFGEPLSYGGQEAFMLNMYSAFKSNNIRYTLATPFNLDNQGLINISKIRNEEIHHYDYPFNSKKRKKYIIKVLKEELKNNHYDVIHIQSGSIYTLLNASKIAKKNNIKRIIVHSHCAGGNGLKYKLIKYISDKSLSKYANTYYACSRLAGECKFNSNIIDNKLIIINNGIDTNNFSFDLNIRNKYRKDFNLDNKLTIINVGRFSLQKNHEFILKIALELKKATNEFKIILVGDGELKEQIISKIKEFNLKDYFIILEKRNDVSSLMMASDVFILPSLYEGLSVTSIEAQASGLKTLCSDTITKETALTDLIEFLPITDPIIWKNKILDINNHNRTMYADKIKELGFDRNIIASFLEENYRR